MPGEWEAEGVLDMNGERQGRGDGVRGGVNACRE